MQKCNSCGADLSEHSRFCGKCGSMQDALATNAAATRCATPQPLSWTPEGGTRAATWSPFSTDPAQGSTPAWSSNVQAPPTQGAENEDEDERKKEIPPWSPLYGAALAGEALLSSGQVSPPGAPVVQGTPQIGSVPGVAGSSTPSTNAPASTPAQGPGNAPVTHPVQGPGNAPISHPVQGPTNAPIGHPVQGTSNAPVNHPAPINHPVQGPVKAPHPQPRPQPIHQPGPRPIHQPPEPPETQDHPPTHKHHRHQDHPEEHEHHQHQAHPARHEPHRAARVTRAAGSSSFKTILLVVLAVVVVAAGGIAASVHSLSHPQPLISITSSYTVGNTPAGAPGTILHISGQQFASNSAITFLLDGGVAPGNQGTRSDANGNFRANITITDAWSAGIHTLTARDASNNSTHNGVSVTVVQPGQANTPGPNGAPPDDASFTLNIPANGRTTTVNEPFPNNNEALHIAGHPDPAGGTVCLDRDNGQQFSASYVANNGTPFTETYTFSCQGSYKGGKISFTETLLTDVITFTDGSGISCTLSSPQLNQQVTGSYSGNGTFTGTWTYEPISQTALPCTDPNQTFYYTSDQGTWTGTV